MIKMHNSKSTELTFFRYYNWLSRIALSFYFRYQSFLALESRRSSFSTFIRYQRIHFGYVSRRIALPCIFLCCTLNTSRLRPTSDGDRSRRISWLHGVSIRCTCDTDELSTIFPLSIFLAHLLPMAHSYIFLLTSIVPFSVSIILFFSIVHLQYSMCHHFPAVSHLPTPISIVLIRGRILVFYVPIISRNTFCPGSFEDGPAARISIPR